MEMQTWRFILRYRSHGSTDFYIVCLSRGLYNLQHLLQRSSVSRYIACGSLESFTLLKATHQGELRTSPYAYDTEQLRARSLLKMTLHAVRPASSPPSSGWQLKEADMGLIVSSLTYSFAGSSSSWTLTDGLFRTPSLQESDHLHQVTGGADQRTALLHEIDRLVAKAVDQMDENQEQEAVDTIAAVALLIRYLDYKDITSLVQLDNHQQRTQLERYDYSTYLHLNC